uniref:Endonuclease n=1 Tax=Pseudomonas phage RVTF4 TaxID=3236931 RepID=A0AB39CCD4_9VIRU
MYEIPPITKHVWSSTHRILKNGDMVPNNGERSTLVTQGVYVIDHIPTGKFIIGQSRTVSAEVDKHIALLKTGRHPNKILQRQYSGYNMDLRMIEIPASNSKEAKKIEAQIRASNTTDYCLLN